MSEPIIHMRCPFCGKADIEYRLALCAGCHADIEYDFAERNAASNIDDQRMKQLARDAEKAERDFGSTLFPFNVFAKKRLDKLVAQMEALLHEMVETANAAVDRRLARGGTNSIATFSRGDRSLDVLVSIPINPSAKVDFDVFLIGHNGKKVVVTDAVRKVTRLSMSQSIKLVQSLPCTLLSGVSEKEAQNAHQSLTDVGAVVEIR
ncbi:ribosomal protein L7/L12 [Sphingobium xenophagum]|uniref:ribosomal protein L7/L12 n=1 Tax=Sphingobium xenophagum TaxID=121428 RepID=UPI000376C239|nr:ribosomal protein L7/L12 [Sphingobium xenophagum]